MHASNPWDKNVSFQAACESVLVQMLQHLGKAAENTSPAERDLVPLRHIVLISPVRPKTYDRLFGFLHSSCFHFARGFSPKLLRRNRSSERRQLWN